MARVTPRIYSVCYFSIDWLKTRNRFHVSITINGWEDRKGGLVLDFVFLNPPDLAVNIQGVYYHYEFGVETLGRDLIARQAALGSGLTLIFIDEDDIEKDPEYYCREALRYKDHSRMAGG